MLALPQELHSIRLKDRIFNQTDSQMTEGKRKLLTVQSVLWNHPILMRRSIRSLELVVLKGLSFETDCISHSLEHETLCTCLDAEGMNVASGDSELDLSSNRHFHLVPYFVA